MSITETKTVLEVGGRFAELMRGSSEDDEEEGAGYDPSIYIRVSSGIRLNSWIAIKKNQTTLNDGKYIDPTLPPEPHRYFSGCVAVGSTIYVFGGVDPDPAYTSFLVPPCVRDVFCIDTLCPEIGWKKLPYSLNKPRAFPYGLHIDGKIYVLGGHRDFKDPDTNSTMEPEVFDTTSYKDEDNDKKEGWRLVGDSVDAPGTVNGHALLDGGKRIVVFGSVKPRLFSYDVGAGTCKAYHNKFGRHRRSAFVDGILYFLDGTQPAFLFALDLSEPDNEVKRVKVLSGLTDDGSDDDYFEWLPLYHGFRPDTFLVSLGRGKLGGVWCLRCPQSCQSRLHVYCSILKMCKKTRPGETYYEARGLSRSDFYVDGLRLISVLAVEKGENFRTDDVCNAEDDKTSATNNSYEDGIWKNDGCKNKKKNKHKKKKKKKTKKNKSK